MRYDEIVQSLLAGEKIYNIPLRVCYYGRVSTESDAQKNSLSNQSEYYENYIRSKPNWTFMGGYVEEGKTGVRVKGRTSFQKMIHDAQTNKFDLIITKEVSRFARDLEDSIHYIRILKHCGVGVYFENQNLHTFDSNSELILNIMFNLAQEESRKLSTRIKFGHREAILKGHVLGSSNITGYRKEKCKLIVEESEAAFIRTLFTLYASGQYGFQKLSKKLFEMGYHNRKGNLYDKDSLKRMIENPKYKGYYRAKTYEVMDYRTKRRKKNDRNEQILYKCEDGSVPAILSEELWEKANEVLKKRTKRYWNNHHWSGGVKYPFSSKIYCREHATNFQRSYNSKRKNRPTWSCGLYLQYRKSACISPIIAEIDLYHISSLIMNKILPSKEKLMNDLLKRYENIDIEEYEKTLTLLEHKIQIIEEKKAMLLDFAFHGDIQRESLKSQWEEYEKEKENLYKEKQELQNRIQKFSNHSSKRKEITSIIEEELEKNLLEDFIRTFIKRIIVSKIKENRYYLKLDIFVNLLGEDKSTNEEHINLDTLNGDAILYLENQVCDTVERKRKNHLSNRFLYNVYLLS